MHIAMAILIGFLYAAGLFMMMRRSIVKLVIGLAILGHAANLLIFTAAGMARARPPLLEAGGGLPGPVADPVPQALILTAIVIGFAVLGFAVVLIYRVHEISGTDDLDQMRTRQESL
jgi:multicomponent Na+:H+ antiporter subunit C